MISRRALIGATTAAALAALRPSHARAETPKRGGKLALRLWDPPHWDPYLTPAFRTQVPYSFTHSRLIKHKAGPAVLPGTFEFEGDLAESWSQPDELTYVFKLHRGVRFQPKPPVNGRELTAADVVYSMERFRSVKGNPQAYLLAMVDKVTALDRHTVQCTLKEPYAWFLDMIASPMTLPIVARECVEKFGDLKKAEATVGTGPWMLERYRPNVGFTLVRHPHYFRSGLPLIDRIEVTIDEDNASRLAAFLAGKYDLGWENGGAINRTDWNAMREPLKRHRPGLRTAEHPSNVVYRVFMRTDKAPFSDVRVRRAISMAINRNALIDAVADGSGWLNGAVPLALGDWGLAVEHMGDAQPYYRHNPKEAQKLLAEAGHPGGFATVMDFNNYGSSFMDDAIALVLRDLKSVGIDAKLNRKEYGAYIATTATGNYEGMYYGATPFLDPDSSLYTNFAPGHPRNVAKVNDPVLTDLLVRQRHTADPTARRGLIHDIQRHAALQQYIIELYSPVTVFVWNGALKNYGPNLGYDYGGRLVAAWLDR
ncbi:MAG TPA: ABC transporter substrate-binding protein [Candidatus Acidoferrum sp.]|nr:ABC transporter substrate-binding protein [Candidatus Acidoferrum sp.]